MPKKNFPTVKNDRPTFLPEKILAFLYRDGKVPVRYHDARISQTVLGLRPKMHEIVPKTRPTRRGDKIQPYIGLGTSKPHKFAPDIEVKSTQKIDFTWMELTENSREVIVGISGAEYGRARFVGEIMVHCAMQLNRLAQNEGYIDAREMLLEYDKDGMYNILHFTELKY